MNDRTYSVLEYDKIKNILSQFAASNMTKEKIIKMKPMLRLEDIEEALDDTFQGYEVIKTKGNMPIGDFHDINELVNMAKKGRSLDMAELLEVAYNLKIVENVAEFLKEKDCNAPKIFELGSLLVPNVRLWKQITDSIISEDEISDNASSTLKKIRREIAQKNERIRSKIGSIATGCDSKNALRDSVVTIRQGRYVVPVKSEQRQKVKGIIHDRSASGSTLFIEPQVVVDLNNQLRELEIEEQKEISRILAELSAMVGNMEIHIVNNQQILEQLDFIFAKSRFAVENNCEKVYINKNNIINIKNGRHPLIDRDDVVPINLSLGKDYKTLIITGPNTGGKTVTLKTLGLFTLMTQSGIGIPVEAGSEIAIFNKIYADIGDEQSIEQSLSTFSSHMKNIVDIVASSDETTLVLADELGAGTDPTEGAALATAILEYLRDRKAITMATTHYTELKKYAVAQKGVQNASMAFDIETLSPTYKLVIGIPGKSNAFEISKKLGLKNEIVDKALGYLNKTDIEFEEVLGSIERDRKQAEEERDEAIALHLQVKKQKEEVDRKLEKLEARKDKIIEEAKIKAENILKDAESLTKKVQRDLSGIDKIQTSSEKHKFLQKNRDKIKNEKAKHKKEVKRPENYKPVKIEELQIGDFVKIISLNQNGDILTLPDSKGNLMVSVGGLRLSANINNIMLLEQNIKDKTGKNGSNVKKTSANIYKTKVMSVATSINIVGKTVDEGSVLVDKYLDDAFIARLKEVTVIHGRGSGVLKKGIWQMLKKHSHVETYRAGTFHEGGDGVTVVVMKREE